MSFNKKEILDIANNYGLVTNENLEKLIDHIIDIEEKHKVNDNINLYKQGYTSGVNMIISKILGVQQELEKYSTKTWKNFNETSDESLKGAFFAYNRSSEMLKNLIDIFSNFKLD